MENLSKIRTLLKLKEVDRYSIIKERRESSAEHSWGCLILANYFFKKINYKIDQLKVLKILTYHDLVEIISKDHYEIVDDHKREIDEEEGFEILKTKIPKELKEEYNNYFKEFEEEKTKEAQFSKAIDKLEVLIHMLDYKEEWIKQKWTEEKLRKFKEHYFIKIPEIHSFFNELVKYLKENNYFIE
jgi:putative hydrolases of HD superfamily